jgi:hypothetical protein
MKRASLAAVVVLGLSCGNDNTAPPAMPDLAAPPVRWFAAQRTDKTFHTADHFLASIEMQLSGEPFAQLLGKNLAGYDRFNATTDLYKDPATGQTVVDPMSYSLAIESYEYSKQPMNNTSFESGAGLALEFGPVLNPDHKTDFDGFTLLHDRLQAFALAASAGGPAGTNWVVSPSPTSNPLNVYGWPGFFPVFAEFSQFQPDIDPSTGATRGCSFVGGYAASAAGAQIVGDYECGSNSLNLPHREMQVVKRLEPDALGYALWKQALWVINYWQTTHDSAGNAITQVADADLAKVGQPGNTVVGQYDDGTGKMVDGAPGVFLGDIPLEGYQGLTMIEEMNNKAALMIASLLTGDGMTLGGFASTKDALKYDYTSPLKWWPASVAVTETGTDQPMTGNSWQSFPQPTQLMITDGKSRLHALSALAGGFGEMFALTDHANPDVGAQVCPRATFDGDPFPDDNQLPDGEETPHDRALANLKVAVIDLDRLHYDAAHDVLVDEATVSGGGVSRGTTVSAVDAAYAIVGLRTALRGISSSLTLYSNDTPDTLGGPTALDAAPLAGAPAPLPARMVQLIKSEANFLVDKLIAQDGSVANSYDVGTGAADASPTTIQAEASVIRGLLDAYLATSDVKYRQAAARVFQDLDKRFWMKDVRAFRTTAGVDDKLTWTPLAFGTLSGALRQYWKLIANQPGNEQVSAELLARVQRMNKLVLNGWDDADQDNLVKYPDECTGAGLQMAERALTGELSHPADGNDRDHDCVPEISAAHLPSALAGEVVLTRQ